MMKATGGVTTGMSVLGLMDQISVTVFDVPLTVVGMATAGTLLSFAHFDNSIDVPRKQLAMLSLFNWAATIGLISVTPDLLGWQWLTERLEAPSALLLALTMPMAIPPFKKYLPELLRKWLRIGEYGTKTSNDLAAYEETDPEPAVTTTKRKAKK